MELLYTIIICAVASTCFRISRYSINLLAKPSNLQMIRLKQLNSKKIIHSLTFQTRRNRTLELRCSLLPSFQGPKSQLILKLIKKSVFIPSLETDSKKVINSFNQQIRSFSPFQLVLSHRKVLCVKDNVIKLNWKLNQERQDVVAII